MAALDPIKNFCTVVVNGLYAAGATTVNLQTGEGASLPQPSSDGAFFLVWWNATDYSNPEDDSNVEIVRCTARSTDQLTVTRGQDGTSDTAKNTGGKTYNMRLALVKGNFDHIRRRVIGLNTSASVTISSGIVTKNAPILVIAGEGGAADTLTDINAASGWSLESGEALIIRPSTGTYDITINETGNIVVGSENLILHSQNDWAFFIYLGSYWRLISTSFYNTAWTQSPTDSTGDIYTERQVCVTASTVSPSTLTGHNLVVQSDSESCFAVNRETNDGPLITFYQASTNEGNITVSGTTVSLTPFFACHRTQFKEEQEPPEGAVLVALAETINGEIEYYEDGSAGKNKVKHFPRNGFIPDPSWERVRKDTSDIFEHRQFPYIDGTTTPNDSRVYGVYHTSLGEKPIDSHFGRNDRDTHLVGSLGLYKIRVTDTNGDIQAGDYLTSSPRKWEAQKQVDDLLHNYSIAKALISVDFSTIPIDPELGYKWTLIPCTLHCG